MHVNALMRVGAPESSPIQVAAQRDSVYVAISVSDHGRGIPPDQPLFQKYACAGDGVRILVEVLIQ